MQIRRGETEVRYTFRPYGDDRIIVRQGTLLVGSVRAVENGAELLDARGVRLGLSSSRPGNDMAVLLCSEIPRTCARSSPPYSSAAAETGDRTLPGVPCQDGSPAERQSSRTWPDGAVRTSVTSSPALRVSVP